MDLPLRPAEPSSPVLPDEPSPPAQPDEPSPPESPDEPSHPGSETPPLDPSPHNIHHHLTTWLQTSHPSITQFWIGAPTWRHWARYDLYLHLLRALPSPDYLLYHSLEDIWPADPNEQLDIFIDPCDRDPIEVGLILRCENVNENEGSFERFRAEMDRDIERVEALGEVSGEHEGMRVFVVGVSGPWLGSVGEDGVDVEMEGNEDCVWRCEPRPRRMEISGGEMNLWVYEVGGSRGGEGGEEEVRENGEGI